ncbi:MAG TPA: DinB family protein [Gemmatimonadales bacterium]|nr:DinB family protein [Gemmatimonadales bacterium]
MDPRVAPLAETVRLNTRLFGNCLDGLSELQAQARPSAATNSAAYIAAHLVESRYYTLQTLGVEQSNPLERYTGGWKSIEEIKEWPSLADIRSAWQGVSAALGERLEAIRGEALDAPVTTQLPLENKTVLSMLIFLVQHDSYHVGQLSLLRKHAGLPAMSYA